MRSVYVILGPGEVESAREYVVKNSMGGPHDWFVGTAPNGGAILTISIGGSAMLDEFKPHQRANASSLTGAAPARVVSIDVTGQVSGRCELTQFLIGMLATMTRFAVFDDYSIMPWTQTEIENGCRATGEEFFTASQNYFQAPLRPLARRLTIGMQPGT